MHHSQFSSSSKVLFLLISLLYLCMLEFENGVCTDAALIIPSNTNETETGETTLEDIVRKEREEESPWHWHKLPIIPKLLILAMCAVVVFFVLFSLSGCIWPDFFDRVRLTNWCLLLDYIAESLQPDTPPATPSPEPPARQDLIEYLNLEIEMHENALAVKEQRLVQDELQRGKNRES